MLKNNFSGRIFGTRPLLNISNRHVGEKSLFYRIFWLQLCTWSTLVLKWGVFLAKLYSLNKSPLYSMYFSHPSFSFLLTFNTFTLVSNFLASGLVLRPIFLLIFDTTILYTFTLGTHFWCHSMTRRFYFYSKYKFLI